MDFKICVSGEGPDLAFYFTKYTFKDQQAILNKIQFLMAAYDRFESRNKENPHYQYKTERSKAASLALSMLNARTGFQETCSQLMCYFLLGVRDPSQYGPFVFSHPYLLLNISKGLSACGLPTYFSRSPKSTESPIDEENDLPEEEEEQETQEVPDRNEEEEIEKERNANDAENEEDGDQGQSINVTLAQMRNEFINSEQDDLAADTKQISYSVYTSRPDGPLFAEVGWVPFYEAWHLTKLPKKKVNADLEEIEPNLEGKHLLQPLHRLSKTFHVILNKIDTTVVKIGPRLPKLDWRDNLQPQTPTTEFYANMILIMFKPHQTVEDLKGGQPTFWRAFIAWDKSTAAIQYMDHSADYHYSRELMATNQGAEYEKAFADALNADPDFPRATNADAAPPIPDEDDSNNYEEVPYDIDANVNIEVNDFYEKQLLDIPGITDTLAALTSHPEAT
ncbi:hypothetical protein HDU98_000364, partial [Podochytrium sp. JEL0797]